MEIEQCMITQNTQTERQDNLGARASTRDDDRRQ